MPNLLSFLEQARPLDELVIVTLAIKMVSEKLSFLKESFSPPPRLAPLGMRIKYLGQPPPRLDTLPLPLNSRLSIPKYSPPFCRFVEPPPNPLLYTALPPMLIGFDAFLPKNAQSCSNCSEVRLSPIPAPFVVYPLPSAIGKRSIFPLSASRFHPPPSLP